MLMNGSIYNKTVSVITPIYKGTKYIASIIEQVDVASRTADCACELILVNDYPEDDIVVPDKRTMIDIRVIDQKLHLGIHGARVLGLKNAEAEYVLFLDQDDRISEDYFASQIGCIGDDDICVCECIHENKTIYREGHELEDVVTFYHMITQGNSILSPGQCLIKNRAIPQEWKDNIMQCNCADDYFLWILMLSKDPQIAFNHSILFEHVVKGTNLSLDFVNLQESEKEMLAIIKNKSLLHKNDYLQLEERLTSNYSDRLRYLQRYRKLFVITNGIIKANKKKSITDRLVERGIHCVAIYGAGDIGHIIYNMLDQRITVKYYIDRDYKNKSEEIDTVPLIEGLEKVDAVIISLTSGFEKVRNNILKLMNVQVVLLDDLMDLEG